MTLVLVDRDALAEVIEQACGNERVYAIYYEPEDVVVQVAVQAGLPIPRPLRQGTVPPVPPKYRFANASEHVVCAAVYRTLGDRRLRCEADAKVVYTSMEQAEQAASRISAREPMKAYIGQCGHYHVARIK